MAVKRVATCPRCGRDVGLVGDFDPGHGRAVVLRLAAHGRPRCPGAGWSVDREDVRVLRRPGNRIRS